MQPGKFLEQSIFVRDDNGNKMYNPNDPSIYPDAFSVGYIKKENLAPQLLSSYFRASYAPNINTSRVATEIPNSQDDVFDVFLGGVSNNYSLGFPGDNNTNNGNTTAVYDRRQTTPNFLKTNGSFAHIFGEIDVKSTTKPSIIILNVKFTGIKNGNNVLYENAYWNSFSIADLRDLLDGKTEFPFTYNDDVTFNLSDFTEERYKFVDTENTCGFFWLCYSFANFGRNVMPSGGLGSYTYLLPTIGYHFGTIKETIDEAVNCYPDWTINTLGGSVPYGVYRRSSWGPGLRTRSTGAGLYPGIYFENAGIEEIYQAELQNASYASFLTLGYTSNISGFTCCAPIMPNTGSVISIWTVDILRDYADKLLPPTEQLCLFVPEGRGDFGGTVQIASLNDIWKHASLFPVWAINGHEYQYPQKTENFWYAEIDGYEFKGNLIRGDDPSLADKVPDWILDGDSGLNEYDPDTDRPIPEAGDGNGQATDDDSQKIGQGTLSGDTFQTVSNVPSFPANIFTLYALNKTNVENFGGSLWSGIGNTAFLENMWKSLDNTGSLNYNECMKYFPLLRWYPINIPSASSVQTEAISGNGDIYFAHGKSPINVGSGAYKLRSYYALIGTTSINVAASGILSDDFTSLTPYATASIYIPYCGVYPIPINELKATPVIYLKSYIDFITGDLLVYVFVETVNSVSGFISKLLFTANGHLGIDLPLSYDSVSQKMAGLAAAVAPAALIGGATIGTLGIAGAVGAEVDLAAAGSMLKTAGATSAGIAGFNAINGLNSNIQQMSVPQTGNSLAMTGDTIPKLMVKKQTYSTPANYGQTIGKEHHHSKLINSMRGAFIKCINPEVCISGATAEENAMIKSFLESGVYV